MQLLPATQRPAPISFNIPRITITVKFDRSVPQSEMPVFQNSRELSEILRQGFNEDTFSYTEEMIILFLNRANGIQGYFSAGSGGITGVVCDPRVILTTALNCAATSLVLCHNHPSGNLKPSRADEEITQKVKQAAGYLDIKVLDHIILNEEGYYSFADEGMI